MIQGIRMVKSYNLENMEINRSENVLNSLFKKTFNLVIGRAKILPILEILGGVAAASVIGFASYRVSIGELSPGSVVGYVTAINDCPTCKSTSHLTLFCKKHFLHWKIYVQLNITPKVRSKKSSPNLKLLKINRLK